MPTNKQRREAARRHLERQLQRRVETDVKRKRRNLILTVIGSILVVVVIVVVSIALVNDDKSKPSAASTPSATDSATDTSTAAPTSSSPPQPQTTGPCGYTQTTAPAAKNVGFPPDPNPTPTTDRTMSITTNEGPITMSLDATLAPCTVQSIAYLAGKSYYDNTSCFRLVTTGIYVLQCGDAANDGSGGPGYEIKDENLDKVDYSVVGTVAMANAGPGTNGSQFFIIYKDSSSGLGKDYTEIGHITAGIDIIQKVAAAGETDTSSSSPGDGAPKLKLTFTKVTVAPPVEGSGTVVTPAASAPAPSGSAPASSTAPVSPSGSTS